MNSQQQKPSVAMAMCVPTRPWNKPAWTNGSCCETLLLLLVVVVAVFVDVVVVFSQRRGAEACGAAGAHLGVCAIEVHGQD